MKIYADRLSYLKENPDFLMVAPQPERPVTTERDLGRGFKVVRRKKGKKSVIDVRSRERVNDISEPVGVYARRVPSNIYAARRVAPPHSTHGGTMHGKKKKEGYPRKENTFHAKKWVKSRQSEERKLRKDALTFGLEKLYEEERRCGKNSDPNDLFVDLLQSVLRFYDDMKESETVFNGFRKKKNSLFHEARIQEIVNEKMQRLEEKGVFENKKYSSSI